MTHQAGSWVPRLERMVTSRGLCSFEKNILITLIGFVIQPNKVYALGQFWAVCWTHAGRVQQWFVDSTNVTKIFTSTKVVALGNNEIKTFLHPVSSILQYSLKVRVSQLGHQGHMWQNTDIHIACTLNNWHTLILHTHTHRSTHLRTWVSLVGESASQWESCCVYSVQTFVTRSSTGCISTSQPLLFTRAWSLCTTQDWLGTPPVLRCVCVFVNRERWGMEIGRAFVYRPCMQVFGFHTNYVLTHVEFSSLATDFHM